MQGFCNYHKRGFAFWLPLIFILSTTISAHAGTFTAFGPKTFIRGTGQPVTETASFNIKNPNTSYTLHVYNGGIRSELTKISSAIIKLNGSTIFDTNDFNQQVAHLQKQVDVTKSNQLEVELRSIPDSGLTVLLEGVDNDPPTITASSEPQPNSFGWNNQDVIVAFTCSDLTSDIAVCPDPVVVSEEGAGQIISGTAIDVAGNFATTAVAVGIDKTPPIIEVTSPQDGSTTNNPKPSITVSYSDALSGIDLSTASLMVDGLDVTAEAMITDTGIAYTPQVPLKDGTHTMTAFVSDKAGNTIAAFVTFTIQLDKCPAVKLPLNTGQRPFIFPEPAIDAGPFYDPYGQVSYWDAEVNDLNKDGILDMLVKNYISSRGGMSVMLGKGDGSFESPLRIVEAAGGMVANVALADFNEDCFPDIATIVYLSNYSYQLRIFLNNGDGTFAQGMTSAINTLGEILTGDFNKDTYKDIAIMGFYGKLLVFQGKGDGSFSGPTEVTIGDSLTMIDSISADFNRDGIIDIAATVIYRNYEATKVVLLTGNGDGTFQAPKVIISEILDTGKLSILVGLAAEDVNMDGIPDILVSTSGHGDYPSGLAVLIGDGSGGFLRKPDFEFNLEMDYLPMRVKDFNGDGIPDIAIRGYSTNSKGYIPKVYILIGNGDGTFKYPMMFNISGNDLNTGDFDNDGAEDLVSTKDHVFVLFAKGDGTFIDRKTIVTTALSADISAADFDGNNTPDLARAGGGNYEGLLFSTILNRGNEWMQSVFQGDKVYRVGDGPAIVKLKDLNDDGRADIVIANELSMDVSVVLNSSNGLKTAVSYRLGGQPTFMAIEDLNGDGFPEIITADKNSENITALVNGGDGLFQARNRYTTGSKPLAIAVGDYNGDGRQDIAVADSSKTVSILFGNGGNSFKLQTISVFDGLTPTFLIKGDFNNDGILDLLVNGYSYSWGGSNSSPIILLIGKGDGSFTKKYVYLEGGGWNPIVMDTNKDGKLDLIPLNRVAVYTGDGNGQFQKGQQLDFFRGIQAVAVGDLNNDGIMDILYVPNSDYDSLGVWLGQGDGTFKQGTYIGGWKDVRSIDIGDIDGDGIADIALSDYKDLHVIYGNGNGAFPGESTLYGRLNNGYLEKGVYLATADFNADHNQDIVINYGSPFDLNKIGIYWGTGYNTFTQGPVLNIPGDFGGPVYTDDSNKDGLQDIIFAQHSWDGKAILTFFNNGDGTFKEAVSYNIGPTRWWPIFEDINKDSHRDIVTIEEQFINQWNYSYSIVIHTGKGDGTFQYFQTVPLESKPGGLVVQDLNGDGFPDVATAVKYGTSWFSYKIEVFINNGNGTFSSFSTSIDGVPLLAEDFNHDGKMDLIVIDGSPDAFALLLGNGDGTFKPFQHYSAGYGSFGKIVSRDFNQDGRQDIAIAYGNTTGYLGLIFNTLPPLRTPPAPPAKLSGKAGDSKVSLSWVANSEEDIAGYNVYRSLSAGGGYVKLNSTTVFSPTYTDTSATNGTTYYYTVSALYTEGEESSYAQKVTAVPNPPDTIPPVVKINNPVNGGTVYSPKLFVLGAINETDAKVGVNGITGTIQKNDNTFTAYDIQLSAGENTITVTAVDAAGNSSTDSIKVVYVPTASISGVVKDELTGQPVQGASVYITDSEKTQSLSTGADGRYFFGKIIPGEVTIMVDSSNYDRITLSKTISSGEALNLDILLPLTPARLSGWVYNSYNYRGIPGATVTIIDRKKTQSVTTYSSGWYEVTNIAPYDVTITVSKPGYETYTEKRTLTNMWTNYYYYYLKPLPPSAPTGLAATPGGGYITLTWNQSPEDLYGYNIYRSTTPGGGYVKLNSWPIESPSYNDTSVAIGTTYYYVITAVNTSQMESPSSIEAAAAPRNVTPPTGLTATAGKGFVEINWSPGADSDISYYKIYRSTASGTGYVYFTNAWGTYYKDKDVTGGTTYYYVVTAINTISKESPYSNEASATPEMLPLSVVITYPYEKASTEKQSIIVRGTVVTSQNEAGVAIEVSNGESAPIRYLAQVNKGQFAAAVKLMPGYNLIKAIAVDSTGNRAEAYAAIYAGEAQEIISLTANPESGIIDTSKEGGTFDVTLRADAPTSNPIVSYAWDIYGYGEPDRVGGSEITARYYSPGLYFPTVFATDSKGKTYTATTMVNVMSKEEIDTILKGKWEGMKGALGSGDVEGAVKYFAAISQEDNRAGFELIKDQLPAIFSLPEELRLNNIRDGMATYDNVVLEEDGLKHSYPVIFVKDGNGLWKILSF